MEQQNAAGAPAKRPAFLTVLCILSFIAQGFAIIGYIGVIALMGAATVVVEAADDALNAMADSLGGSSMQREMGEVMAETPGMGLTWAYIIVGFICVIISLVGVIQMWKLKKTGFYLYTAASVISMIMGIVYSGTEGIVMALVIPIAFIVMYGLNLKAMK